MAASIASIPSELLRVIVDLAHPSLPDGVVDYEHERQRKIDLVSFMLVSKLFCSVARPLYESFVAFGSAEAVEKWIERVNAGAIDAEVVRDVTLRPLLNTVVVNSMLDGIFQQAASQAMEFADPDGSVRRAHGNGTTAANGPNLTMYGMFDMLWQQYANTFYSSEESSFISKWVHATDILFPQLNCLRSLRLSEIEILLGGSSPTCAIRCAIGTIEWQSSLTDPDRSDTDCPTLWARLWAWLDMHPRLTHLWLGQDRAFEWAGPSMTAIPAGIAGQLSFLAIDKELGEHVFESTLLNVDMPVLQTLVISGPRLPDQSVSTSRLVQSTPSLRQVVIHDVRCDARVEEAVSEIAYLIACFQTSTIDLTLLFTKPFRGESVLEHPGFWDATAPALERLSSSTVLLRLRRLRFDVPYEWLPARIAASLGPVYSKRGISFVAT